MTNGESFDEEELTACLSRVLLAPPTTRGTLVKSTHDNLVSYVVAPSSIVKSITKVVIFFQK